MTYGVKAEEPSSRVGEYMTAAAKIIWEIVYAKLATPAAWPRKLHQPTTHAQMATCSGGTTCLVTKYIPPAVG